MFEKDLPFSKVALLGIPIDNLTLSETLAKIFDLIERLPSTQEGTSPFVGTVNTDFIVNMMGWRWNTPRHPELLHDLREAEMNTPDGAPLVWLSQLLGCPLKQRVTGADLLPLILQECEKRGKSVYFFGGDTHFEDKLLPTIQKLYPTLKIAGHTAPHVSLTGESLEFTPEQDELVILDIQKAKPDVLLISLGNPKQEIWFQRIRYQLKIPISIGIGGALNFLIGKIQRAPIWMQKRGLEWIYRLLKEPTRLWKRYFVDAYVLIALITPLTILNRLLKWRATYLPQNTSQTPFSAYSFKVDNQVSLIITLPSILDKQELSFLTGLLKEDIQKGFLVFDFKNVLYIDAVLIALFMEIIKNSSLKKIRVLFLEIPYSIQSLLNRHRVWDLFEVHVLHHPQDLITVWQGEVSVPLFSISYSKTPTKAIIHVLGSLDASQHPLLLFERMIKEIQGLDCELDLRYCSFLDSSGIGLFLKLKRYQAKYAKKLILSYLSPAIKQTLRIAQVDSILIPT